MNKYYKLVIALFFGIITFSALPVSGQEQLAFPGAEGFGRFTTGGRGGIVYEVTNLNNTGPGSLRQGLEMSGARTIVFRVSGTIDLATDIKIRNGNLTIAGQTAPGDGITIKGSGLVIDANNIIIRYIRIRPGDITGRELDALWGRQRSDIIIDHCSLSWSTDEVGSFYDNERFTLQWCILSESLYESVHGKGRHGYGGIWGGKNGATFHHNLLAHHTSRNPRFNGARYTTTTETEFVDFRNNVIYNWGSNSAYGGEGGNHNIIANYYKPGPATQSGAKQYRIVDPDFSATVPLGKWYVAENYVAGNATVTADNWSGGVQGLTATQLAEARVEVPFAAAPVTTQTAVDAFESVLEHVGVSHRRDPIDMRIVEETRTGTATYGGVYGAGKGIIDTQETVGGWPELEEGTAPVDTDKDGMPDEWELANGLNIADPADRNGDLDEDGYTNLEEYLNSLVEAPPAFLMIPPQQTAPENGSGAVDYAEAVLTWVHDAPSFKLYLGISAKKQELVASGIAENTIAVSDLSPETEYFWRVEAVAENGTSISSQVWSFTTLTDMSLLPAVNPVPAAGSADVGYEELALEWTSDAPSHNVFLGTSADDMVQIASGISGLTYNITNLSPSTEYFWRVEGVDGETVSRSEVWSFTTAAVTSVDGEVLEEFFKCSPNPFSESLKIEFKLHSSQAVELSIYDMNNKLVKTILKSSLAAGAHQVQVNGRELQEGMYICVLRTPKNKVVRRLVHLGK